MSLLDATCAQTDVPQLAFYCLFSGCTSITAAPSLPATTLAEHCYMGMFYGCTSLTAAPSLPATTLVKGCYQMMFGNCTSLTAAPALPATALADYCYYQMFDGCTSLTTAPSLPATTLADYCYSCMFDNCTSLTTAPSLPATTLAEYCYLSTFTNCTSLTAAPALPATTLADYCYAFMFYGCTNLTAAPSLPATTLTSYCYAYMFEDCTNLTTAPALPATTLAKYCYYEMFYGCTSLTTAPALPATTLADYCYVYMFQSCTSLNKVTVNFTDWNTDGYATYDWLDGVAATGTFYCPASLAIPAAAERDASNVPSGWNIVTTPDEETSIFDKDGKEVTDWDTYHTQNPSAVGYTENTNIDKENVFVKQSDNSYKTKKLVVIDGSDFVIPEAIQSANMTAEVAEYTRDQSGHTWGTLCLPFGIKAGDGGYEYFELDNVSGSTMSFKQIADGTTIEAGTPVIVKLNGSTTVTGNNVEVKGTSSQTTVTNWTLTGTLKALDRMPEGFFFNGDQFWFTDYTNYSYAVQVPAYRAYFTTSSQNAPARFDIAVMNIAGEVTAIGSVDAQGNLQMPEDGKFIQNGRLMIRKNGQVFDANGKVIK